MLMNVNVPTLNTQYINEKYIVLLFGLGHHFSTKLTDVAIEVEFEQFCEDFLRKLTYISDNDLTSLKTKLRSICKNSSKCVPTTNTSKMKLNNLRKFLEASMAI